MISANVEESLNKRLLLILILSLILFVSCQEGKTTLALISNSGGEISFVDGKTSVLLTLDSDMVSNLISLSGLGKVDIIHALAPDAEVYSIPPYMYQKRLGYLDLLMYEFTDTNRVDVIKANSKLLLNSKLLKEMDLNSSNYDSAMVKQTKNVDNTLEFELSSIIEGADNWEQIVEFFSDWRDIIL